MEYERLEYSEEGLEFLRKNTVLGPINYIKVLKARKCCENFRKWYLEMENELLELDYTIALEYEFELRFDEWKDSLYPDWLKYGDGRELLDFAVVVMKQNMEKSKKKVLNK